MQTLDDEAGDHIFRGPAVASGNGPKAGAGYSPAEMTLTLMGLLQAGGVALDDVSLLRGDDSHPASRHDSRKTEDFLIFRIFLGQTRHCKSLCDLLGDKSAL